MIAVKTTIKMSKKRAQESLVEQNEDESLSSDESIIEEMPKEQVIINCFLFSNLKTCEHF